MIVRTSPLATMMLGCSPVRARSSAGRCTSTLGVVGAVGSGVVGADISVSLFMAGAAREGVAASSSLLAMSSLSNAGGANRKWRNIAPAGLVRLADGRFKAHFEQDTRSTAPIRPLYCALGAEPTFSATTLLIATSGRAERLG